jgi:prephenate dehydratase
MISKIDLPFKKNVDKFIIKNHRRTMKKIAFQGEKGAFSEDAAFRFWNTQIVPCPQKSFINVFHAVQEGRCAFGIIPIENSQTGSIHQNVDLLLEYNLSIVGEIVLRIRHCLLTTGSVRIGDIRKIFSHPQALEQCSEFLGSLKNVEIVPAYDTAGSARFIAENRIKNGAAIASIRAGEDYGLVALRRGIENHEQNYTRFLIISKTSVSPTRKAKTSVVFSLKDIPGGLFKALSVFALRDINLLKIESRPLRKGRWKYWFYLDFEGAMLDPACARAIDHLGEITMFLKVLGSYPVGKVVE